MLVVSVNYLKSSDKRLFCKMKRPIKCRIVTSTISASGVEQIDPKGKISVKKKLLQKNVIMVQVKNVQCYLKIPFLSIYNFHKEKYIVKLKGAVTK